MLFELASEHRSRAYKVLELREKLIGGKMSGDKLEKILNEHGAQGWQLKAVTALEVKGELVLEASKGSLSPSKGPSPLRHLDRMREVPNGPAEAHWPVRWDEHVAVLDQPDPCARVRARSCS